MLTRIMQKKKKILIYNEADNVYPLQGILYVDLIQSIKRPYVHVFSNMDTIKVPWILMLVLIYLKYNNFLQRIKE